jgi:hypothetical protein
MNLQNMLDHGARLGQYLFAGMFFLALYFITFGDNPGIGVVFLGLTAFFGGIFFTIHLWIWVTDSNNEFYSVLDSVRADPWWSPAKILAAVLRLMHRPMGFIGVCVLCLCLCSYYSVLIESLTIFLFASAGLVFIFYVFVSVLFMISNYDLITKKFFVRIFRANVKNTDVKNKYHQVVYFALFAMSLILDLIFLVVIMNILEIINYLKRVLFS